MKYTKQQEAFIKAGATLCIECKRGYNGNKSCGSLQVKNPPKSSILGCFCGEKIKEE